MAVDNLIFEQFENYVIVRINRPEKKNALHFKLLHEIKEMFTNLKENPSIKIVILTGYKDENTSFFSSGIDLNELQKLNSEVQSKEELSLSIKDLQDTIHAIEDVGKVVIAQITGFCFGSALEIALACDFIIVSPETMFGLLEVKYGIIPDLGGTFRLVRRVGYQFSKQIIMLAERFSAQESLRMGLINWVIDLNEIEKFTEGIVNQLLQNKIGAVIAAKNLIDQIHPIKQSTGSQYEREAQINLLK